MDQGPHWIFDGYNVMHALDKIPQNVPFELAREQFIAWLSPFAADGKKVTVVFDGPATYEPCPSDSSHGIHVLFSHRGLNADGAILALIRRSDPHTRSSLTIVTGDLPLRDAIFQYGCGVLSPKAFLRDELHTHRFCFTPNPLKWYQPFKEYFQ